MKILNGDRHKVARWIDYQFQHNGTFPSKCVLPGAKDRQAESISPEHLKAYREWGKTPVTGEALADWVDQWLNEQDQQRLSDGLRRLKQ